MKPHKSDDIQIAHDENLDQGQGDDHTSRSKAVEFLAGNSSEQPSFTYEEEKAVLRRIDSRVLILVLWAYFFQQLDKSTLRYLAQIFPLRVHSALHQSQLCVHFRNLRGRSPGWPSVFLAWLYSISRSTGHAAFGSFGPCEAPNREGFGFGNFPLGFLAHHHGRLH